MNLIDDDKAFTFALISKIYISYENNKLEIIRSFLSVVIN